MQGAEEFQPFPLSAIVASISDMTDKDTALPAYIRSGRPCFAQEKGLIRSQITGPYRDDTIFARGFFFFVKSVVLFLGTCKPK